MTAKDIYIFQQMITSIKDSNGKVFATIVPMKDGRWLEIKRNYKFHSEKQIFVSEDDWIHSHEYSGVSLMPVYGEREPYVPVKERRKQNPLSATLKNKEYLEAIQEKYKIYSKEPRQILTLLDSELSHKYCIYSHQSALKTTEDKNYKLYLQTRIDQFEAELSAMQEKITSIGREAIPLEFHPLTRKQTIAYIQKNDEFLPVGYSKTHGGIVFQGKFCKSFSEMDSSDHPILWILYKNTFIQAI